VEGRRTNQANRVNTECSKVLPTTHNSASGDFVPILSLSSERMYGVFHGSLTSAPLCIRAIN
jgi:hypothetical protein